jgi:hypothetical protein
MKYKERNLTKNGNRIIKIAFLELCDDSLVTKCASYLTANETEKSFSHVELMFSDGTVTSITQHPGFVHYDSNRYLSNTSYKYFFEIYVSPKEELVMDTYAKSCVNNKITFNKCGMYWNFIPCLSYFAYTNGGKSMFCSEYVTKLLQTIGYLSNLDPSKTSPNDLYLAMKNCKSVKIGFNSKLYKAQKEKM